MPSLGGLQEYLNAAVQLKTALVKSRPGRQEWEQAPPFLRSTAAATPEVQRAREQGDFNEQYRLALQLKEQGNELVNKAPEEALEKYSQALSVFLWFDRGPKKDAEDVPLVCAAEKLQGAEQEQAHHVLALAFCNAAACLLALGMTADAAYACSKALKYDPYNVKALYRRALAHRRTDTRAGLEAAVTDLAAANTLEPANNQVRMALTSLQHELRELRRKERGLYGNMFERGELYDGTAAGGGASSSAGAAAGPSAGGAEASSASARAELPAPGTKPAKQQEQGGRGGRGDGDGQGEDDEDGWLDEDRDEHDWGPGASGRDSEDQLLLDQRRRKAKATAASREADVVMRRMQRSLAAARNRKMAERLNVERARQGGAGPFPWYLVPWWAYVLILLHLTYRVIKIWKVPVPAHGTAPVPAAAEPHDAGVLHGGEL
ncbi:hypothetical protein HYH03_016145 [Edaphochlamys debaryana]|uniref:Uncharacterized protein n=1 Tax=Edaphochlamys debaryana TaxID=47281 RepID=A0A835XMQ5_9CHLO|nr:hypothetical protein HYH03_016145 [Edaphochlamys debaryana]|eukprot:KAG2485046.1 hypothetical protein HYH03_016145 [Edaphochlamys debaryana]